MLWCVLQFGRVLDPAVTAVWITGAVRVVEIAFVDFFRLVKCIV